MADFIAQLIRAGDAPSVILIGLWLLLAGKVRLGREYDDMKEQRDRAIAEGRANAQVMREAADVAERAVSSEVH